MMLEKAYNALSKNELEQKYISLLDVEKLPTIELMVLYYCMILPFSVGQLCCAKHKLPPSSL